MLWQQIRHSKEQQTFSATSNRAALSALLLCDARALKLLPALLPHTHTLSLSFSPSLSPLTHAQTGLQQW